MAGRRGNPGGAGGNDFFLTFGSNAQDFAEDLERGVQRGVEAINQLGGVLRAYERIRIADPTKGTPFKNPFREMETSADRIADKFDRVFSNLTSHLGELRSDIRDALGQIETLRDGTTRVKGGARSATKVTDSTNSKASLRNISDLEAALAKVKGLPLGRVNSALETFDLRLATTATRADTARGRLADFNKALGDLNASLTRMKMPESIDLSGVRFTVDGAQIGGNFTAGAGGITGIPTHEATVGPAGAHAQAAATQAEDQTKALERANTAEKRLVAAKAQELALEKELAGLRVRATTAGDRAEGEFVKGGRRRAADIQESLVALRATIAEASQFTDGDSVVDDAKARLANINKKYGHSTKLEEEDRARISRAMASGTSPARDNSLATSDGAPSKGDPAKSSRMGQLQAQLDAARAERLRTNAELEQKTAGELRKNHREYMTALREHRRAQKADPGDFAADPKGYMIAQSRYQSGASQKRIEELRAQREEILARNGQTERSLNRAYQERRRELELELGALRGPGSKSFGKGRVKLQGARRSIVTVADEGALDESLGRQQERFDQRRTEMSTVIRELLSRRPDMSIHELGTGGRTAQDILKSFDMGLQSELRGKETLSPDERRRLLAADRRDLERTNVEERLRRQQTTKSVYRDAFHGNELDSHRYVGSGGLLGDIPVLLRSLKERTAAQTPDARGYHVVSKEVESAQKRLLSLQNDLGNASSKVWRNTDTHLRQETERLQRLIALRERLKTATSLSVPTLSKEMVPVLNEDGTQKMRRGKPVMRLQSLLDDSGKPRQTRTVEGAELDKLRENNDREISDLEARLADGTSLKALRNKINMHRAEGNAGEVERLQKYVTGLQDRALAAVRESFRTRAESLFRSFRRLDVNVTSGMSGAFGSADIAAMSRQFEGLPETAANRGKAHVLRQGLGTLEAMEDTSRTQVYDQKLGGIDRGIAKHRENIARALRAGQTEWVDFYKGKLAEAEAFRRVVKTQRDAYEKDRTFIPKDITEGGTYHERLTAIHDAAQVIGAEPTGKRKVTVDDDATNRARRAELARIDETLKLTKLVKQKHLTEIEAAEEAQRLAKRRGEQVGALPLRQAVRAGLSRELYNFTHTTTFDDQGNKKVTTVPPPAKGELAQAYLRTKKELADLEKGGTGAIKRVLAELEGRAKQLRATLAGQQTIPTYKLTAADIRKELDKLETEEAARRETYLQKYQPKAPEPEGPAPKAVSLSGRQVENEIADLQQSKAEGAHRLALIRKQLAGADKGDAVLISEAAGIEKSFKEIDRKVKTLNKKLKEIAQKEVAGEAGALIDDPGHIELEGKIYRRGEGGKWQRHTKAGFRGLLPTETARMEALDAAEAATPPQHGTVQERGENAVLEQIMARRRRTATEQEVLENNYLKQLRRRNRGTDEEYAQDERRRALRAQMYPEEKVNATGRPARQPRSDADRIEAGIISRTNSVLRATEKRLEALAELAVLQQAEVRDEGALKSATNKLNFHTTEAARLKAEIVRLEAGDITVLKRRNKGDAQAAGAATEAGASGGGRGGGGRKKKTDGAADDTGGSLGVQRSGTVVRVHLVSVDTSAARQMASAFKGIGGGGGVPRVSRTAADQAMDQLNDTQRRRATASARRITAGERTLDAANPEFKSFVRKYRRIAPDENGTGGQAPNMDALVKMVDHLNTAGVRRLDARSAVSAVGNVTMTDLAAAERASRVASSYSTTQQAAGKATRSAGQAARDTVTPLASLQRNYSGLAQAVHETTRAELDHIKAAMAAKQITGQEGAAQAYHALAKDPNLRAAKISDTQRLGVLDLEMRPHITMNRTHLQQSAEAGKAMGAEMQLGIQQGLGPGDKLLDRLFKTAGHVAMRDFAGMFVYGITNQIGQTIKAGLETESTYIRVSAALDATGKSADGMRSKLARISSDTGAPLMEVYKSASQLVGVFDSVNDVVGVTRLVYELQAVSAGALNAEESFRSLTAITTAYGMHGEAQMRRVADMATNLQLQIGVNVEDTLEGAARLAPIAKQYGMRLPEIATLTGVVGKATGQTGQGASEQVGRILETLNTPRVRQLLTTFKGPDGKPIATDQQFQQGQYGLVVNNLMKASAAGSLDNRQQTALASALGGQRNFASASAILNQAQTYLRGLDAAEADNNKTATLAADINRQLQNEIKRLSQNFTNLGAVLIHSGILGGLDLFLRLLNGILSPLVGMAGAIGDLVGTLERLTHIGFLGELGKWAVALGAVAIAARALKLAFGGAAMSGKLVTKAGAAAAASATAGLPAAAAGDIAAVNAARMATVRNVVGQTAGGIWTGATRPVTTAVRGGFSAVGAGLRGAGWTFTRLASIDLADKVSIKTLRLTDGLQTGLAKGGSLLTRAGDAFSNFSTKLSTGIGGLTGLMNALNLAAVAGMIGFMIIKGGLDQIKASGENVEGQVAANQNKPEPTRNETRTSVAEREVQKAQDPGFMRVQGRFWSSFWHRATHPTGKQPSFYEDAEISDKNLDAIFKPSDTLFKTTIPNLKASGPELIKQKLTATQTALKQLDDAEAKAVESEKGNPGRQARIVATTAATRAILQQLATDLSASISGLSHVLSMVELQGLQRLQTIGGLNGEALARNAPAITNLIKDTSGGKELTEPLTAMTDPNRSQYQRDVSAHDLAIQKVKSLQATANALVGTADYQQAADALAAAINEEQASFDRIIANLSAASQSLITALASGSVTPQAALGALKAQHDELQRRIASMPANQRNSKEYNDLLAADAQNRQQTEQIKNQPALNSAILGASKTRNGTEKAQYQVDQASTKIKVLKDSNTYYIAGTKTLTDAAVAAEADLNGALISKADAINSAANAAAAVPIAGLTDPLAIATANLNETRRQLAQGNLSDEQTSQLKTTEAQQQNAVYDATQAQKTAEQGAAIASIQDPVARAQAELNETLRQEAANRGRNATQAASLLAQERQNRIALTQAIVAQNDAHDAYLLAVSDAKGAGTAPSARLRLNTANRHVADAKKTGSKTAISSAMAEQAGARAALRDAALQDTMDSIDFNKEMNQITGADAIAQLQQILKQKDLTRAERRDILRKIKGYQSAGDAQWNLGEITMPTVYQVRRAISNGVAATGAAGVRTDGGGNVGYQDNRQVTIQIYGGNVPKVQAVLGEQLGKSATGRVTVKPRKV